MFKYSKTIPSKRGKNEEKQNESDKGKAQDKILSVKPKRLTVLIVNDLMTQIKDKDQTRGLTKHRLKVSLIKRTPGSPPPGDCLTVAFCTFISTT